MDAPATPAQQRIAELVGACSIEISPRDEFASERLAELFDPGTAVFVNFPPSATYAELTAACARLQRSGFAAVPHIVARRFAGFSEASDVVRRLVDGAGVTRVLLLGGDTLKPAGPFDSALALLSTGVVERHGITAVAFAGYPEGHPQIGGDVLQAALQAKLEVARRGGLAASVVTQFGFEAPPILRWIAARRAEGFYGPIHVGLAGPASVATLSRYAMRCRIGASLRALTRGYAAIARILTEANPDALIEVLVAGENATAPIDGLHIFTFGGMRRTAAWQQAIARRLRVSPPRVGLDREAEQAQG